MYLKVRAIVNVKYYRSKIVGQLYSVNGSYSYEVPLPYEYNENT